jgi:DNA repair protein RecN (Recombination protein N)
VLKSLIINNIVLIDKAEIEFNKGLCILSGETGSGKSILLDALGLAIGFRSNSKLVGSHDIKANVTAEFDISLNPQCQEILTSNEIINSQNPHQLIIRRILSENISSKVFVNDVPISVNLLAKIGESLVEIHGQHEQRGLLNPANHLIILDEFASNQILNKDLKKIYDELSKIDNEIADFEEKKSAIAREKDYLEHVINEINDAKIFENEEQILVQKKDHLIAKEKILNFISDIKNSLTEASSNLFQSQKILSRNHNLVENFLKNEAENFFSLSEKTDIQINDIEDSVKNLEQICKELNSSQDSKEEIEERLFLIRNLSRKFNCNANELEKLAQDSQIKLSTLNHEEKLSQDLIIKRQEYFIKYQKIAQDLSKKRKKSALELAKKVEEELDFLKMAGTKFLVEIIENKSLNLDEKNSVASKNYFPNGFEKAIFKASLNKNNFDEITKIASGGELSRFMLALKVALMNVKSVPTIIFDEIDTGIGGSTSDAVGKRLKTLSQNSQILVVTHQPQIASKADIHLKISKSEIAGKVKTKIEILDKNSKINEIARMLSGEEISMEAMSASKKLLEENNTK